jgi:hypothetical protein
MIVALQGYLQAEIPTTYLQRRQQLMEKKKRAAIVSTQVACLPLAGCSTIVINSYYSYYGTKSKGYRISPVQDNRAKG